jgi:Domain of unknown function (DUF4124)
LLIAALCAVAFAQSAVGAIFKCQDAQGKVTYQQKPCEGTPAAVPGAPAPTIPAKPVDATGAAGPTDRTPEMATLTFLVHKYQCDLDRPAFAQQTRANYEHWRKRNMEKIAELETNANNRLLLEDARKKPAANVTPAQMDKNCRDVAQYLDQESRR